MKSKHIKGLLLGWCVILFVGFLAGCGNSMYKEVDFGGTFSNSEINIEPLLIEEHDELVSVFAEYEIEWKNGLAIWERYDISFFENNALIVYFFGVSGDVSPLITVDGVQINDEVIKISLVQHGTSAGLVYFKKSIVLEISKSYIGESNSVEVDIKVK